MIIEATCFSIAAMILTPRRLECSHAKSALCYTVVGNCGGTGKWAHLLEWLLEN